MFSGEAQRRKEFDENQRIQEALPGLCSLFTQLRFHLFYPRKNKILPESVALLVSIVDDFAVNMNSILTEDNGAGGEQASNTSDTSEDKDKESKDIQMEDPVCITMEYFRFVNSLVQVQAGLIQVLQDCYK